MNEKDRTPQEKQAATEGSPSDAESVDDSGDIENDDRPTGDVESGLKKLTEAKPREMMEFMAMEMSSGGNPLHKKMTGEHVTQLLDLAAKHDEREYDLQKNAQKDGFIEGQSNRRYSFAVFLVVIALTVFVL